MSQSVKWDRKRSSSSKFGHRQVTRRPSFSPSSESFQTEMKINLMNENDPEEEKKPFRFKKSELLPPDPRAPIFVQFGKVVKSCSMHLLKSIGENRKDLRPSLNDAYDFFFSEFDSWWRTVFRVSQRKISEPTAPKGLLKDRLNECHSLIAPLREERSIWKKANSEIVTFLPEPIRTPDPQELVDDDKKELLGEINALINLLDNLSINTQQNKVKDDNVREDFNDFCNLLNYDFGSNFSRQMSLRERLIK